MLCLYSLSITPRCAKHLACWANTKHSGRPPEDGRDRGTTLAGKTMRTRYKYQKCKNTFFFLRETLFESQLTKNKKKINSYDRWSRDTFATCFLMLFFFLNYNLTYFPWRFRESVCQRICIRKYIHIR